MTTQRNTSKSSRSAERGIMLWSTSVLPPNATITDHSRLVMAPTVHLGEDEQPAASSAANRAAVAGKIGARRALRDAAIHASIAVAEPCRRFCKGGGMALARGCRGYIGEAKPPSHPKVISQISPSVRQSK
jgi:hypothetical protein